MAAKITSTPPDPEKLPWIERYRARSLDEIIGHDADIATIRNLIKKKSMPHWLFYGPPGTGKTSLILALARELYGEDSYKSYIKEINASSDRGIDTIRVDVKKYIKTRSDKVKLIILDEFDAMTDDAQGALNGVIEKYSGKNRFCLICNNINKVIEPIQSRCVKMRFCSIGADAIKRKLSYIIEKEGIKIEPDAIEALIELEPDFRQLLNKLQGIHFMYDAMGEVITKEAVYKYLYKPRPEEIDEIVRKLLEDDFDSTYRLLVDIILSNRWSIVDMLQYLLRKLLKLSINIDRKNFLIEKLAEIEFRVKNSRDSEIQLAHLVSSFVKSRSIK